MKVGVIGAGTMGAGIAQIFAQTEGYSVRLCDVSKEIAENGRNRIETALGKLVKRGKLSSEEYSTIMSNISVGVTEECLDCDLIVEAALEVMEVKQETFRKLHEISKPDCIFATNTSSLSITQIGQGIGRPVIGMHFFNPAPVMKLIEIIAGLNTPKTVVKRVKDIAEEIGKVPVEAEESAGFIVNRVLVPMINEAVGVYAEGVASAKEIDTAMKLGANHPIGPLALGDLIGLDVCLAIMEVLKSETGDSKYRPHPLLRKMVRGGRLGRKTGQGFFTY